MFIEPAAPLARVWQGQKQRSTRTGNAKNTPGTDYPSKITHRQDADFNEIHTDANGDFFLYNVKTDAWDILGDSADIPYYGDVDGILWAYSIKTGEWDIPVDEPSFDLPLRIEEVDNIPCFEESVDKNRELLEGLSDDPTPTA
jgi:hypothetical protein